MIRVRFASAFSVFAFSLTRLAAADTAPVAYQTALHDDHSTGVTFASNYTFGVHRGNASQLSGQAQVQLAPFSVSGARFSVPIDSLSTGNTQRDCHLREALGLDYARPGSSSRFPANHVCDDHNQIPAGAGDDSIVFPEIQAEVLSYTIVKGGPDLKAGAPIDLEAKIRWTIHGVAQERALPAHVELVDAAKGTLRLNVASDTDAVTTLKLSEFQILVKPFMGLVHEKDPFRVTLDLLMQPQP